MNQIGTFNLVLLALIIALLAILYVIITKLQSNTSYRKNSKQNTSNTLTINDLLRVASNNSSTKEELQNALFELVDNFSFPAKVNGRAPESAKPFLDFVNLLASHKNSDAKLIVLASKEIKKRNPSYTKEIDIYEDRGINHRR